MSANLKWAKSGKPDFASESAQLRSGIRKMPRRSAERRAPYVTGREMPRHGISNVPRHGTLRCGDPHQRLSALRPLSWGNTKCLKPRRRKLRVSGGALLFDK